REAALNELGELAGFTQVLVLLHVAENETKRVARVEAGTRLLETDRGVLHPLDATRVFGTRFGEEIRLDSARALGILPSQVGGVDGKGDEEMAAVSVGDAAAIVERDQCVRGARIHGVEVVGLETRAEFPGDGEGDVLLVDLWTAADRPAHSIVDATVARVDDH